MKVEDATPVSEDATPVSEEEEEVDLSEYEDFGEAHASSGTFIAHVYLHQRIYSALGYLTPR